MSALNARISKTAASSEWDLVITRVFDAPRELVFQAWTDPQHVAQWWGPKGCTTTVQQWEMRAGGALRLEMRLQEFVHPMSGVFEEVTEPDRLVFVASALDQNGNSMFDVHSIVTFAERQGKTELTVELRVLRTTAEGPQYLSGMKMGWTQQLDRLEEKVAAMRNQK